MLEDMTLYQAFHDASIKVPNETAIYYEKTKISFAKLQEKIDHAAAILQNQFLIKKGDVILVSLPNIPQTIILFYAINKIGAVVNMVHPNSPCEVMQKYYDDSECKMAFLFDQKVYKELIDYKKFNGHIVICSAGTYLSFGQKRAYESKISWSTKMLKKTKKFLFFEDFHSTDVNPASEVVIDKNETSVLLHSASTTGISKTIMLSARSFNCTSSHTLEFLCMRAEELIGKSMMSVLPSFHGFGLCMTMHVPLTNCFGVVLIPKFSAYNVAKMMNRCKNVICICGVPNVFRALLNEKAFVNNKYLKVLTNCFSGGDSLSSSIKENFDSLMIRKESKCRLFEGYGLTEVLSVCALNTKRKHKFGSIGYPISGVEFRILDEKDNVLGPNELGEIAIKSENNMLGYFKSDNEDKNIYSDGYLKTGDLGYLDEDGFLFFQSRKKRVIKVSGVAVFPHEIEAVISRMSGIDAVCVVQIPDEKLTHAIKAIVVGKNKNKDRIIAECQRYLISWAVPKEIEFVNSLPYTRYHKVNYLKVQEEENKKYQTRE